MSKLDYLHAILALLVALAPFVGILLERRGNARAATILRAVVLGVEKANNGDVKGAIQSVAEDHGVQDALHDFVQKVTEPKPGAST